MKRGLEEAAVETEVEDASPAEIPALNAEVDGAVTTVAWRPASFCGFCGFGRRMRHR